MEFVTYAELQSHLQELFRAGEYAAGLALVNDQFDLYPEHTHLLIYWRAVLSARLGNAPGAIEAMRLPLERGFWWGERLLRKSPSFQSLQDLPEFSELVQLNEAVRASDPEASFPLLTLRPQGHCQAGGPPCPLFIGLHSNAATAQDSIDFWRPAATAGWLVAIPQSTQAVWKGAYVWDDYDIAAAEIQKHFRALNEQYAVDPRRVVVAGHSLGGETALRLALTGAVPARGVVAFGPGGPLEDNLDAWTPVLADAIGRDLRAYVIFGEEDDSIPQENVRILVDMLNEVGIPCDLEEVPHAGHDFSPEYESSLQRALEFIFELQ